MINFKFDDKTDIENKMSVGYVNQENPEETIRDLARYNHHVLNMKKEDKSVAEIASFPQTRSYRDLGSAMQR